MLARRHAKMNGDPSTRNTPLDLVSSDEEDSDGEPKKRKQTFNEKLTTDH